MPRSKRVSLAREARDLIAGAGRYESQPERRGRHETMRIVFKSQATPGGADVAMLLLPVVRLAPRADTSRKRINNAAGVTSGDSIAGRLRSRSPFQKATRLSWPFTEIVE